MNNEKEKKNFNITATNEKDFFEQLKGRGINGLQNLGNTCYVNTTLQCLGHTTSFLTHILCQKWKTDDKDRFHDEFYLIYKALWVNNKSVIPMRFIKSISKYVNAWEVNWQSDMHEFIIFCIDSLNREICTQLPKYEKNLGIKPNTYDLLQHKADVHWNNMIGKEYSSLISIFYGQIINQIVCKKCDSIYHNYEPFSALMLPISDNGSLPLSLNDCIINYFKAENLNENSKNWKCDKCKTYEPCLKTLKFWRLPKTLIICLKRFDMMGNNKNNKKIDFPTTLDLSDNMIGPEEKKYDLVSVANHYGQLMGGHYNAYTKDPNNNWFLHDDLSIEKCKSVKDVITQNAYVLFYNEK